MLSFGMVSGSTCRKQGRRRKHVPRPGSRPHLILSALTRAPALETFPLLSVCGRICGFIHGILVDPKLKGNPINPFDGEKLFVESCLLIVVLTATWAWRSRFNKDRHERIFKTGRYRALPDINAGDGC